jgi:hypothetical protein
MFRGIGHWSGLLCLIESTSSRRRGSIANEAPRHCGRGASPTDFARPPLYRFPQEFFCGTDAGSEFDWFGVKVSEVCGFQALGTIQGMT